MRSSPALILPPRADSIGLEKTTDPIGPALIPS